MYMYMTCTHSLKISCIWYSHTCQTDLACLPTEHVVLVLEFIDTSTYMYMYMYLYVHTCMYLRTYSIDTIEYLCHFITTVAMVSVTHVNQCKLC